MDEMEPPDEQQRDAVKRAQGEGGRDAPEAQTLDEHGRPWPRGRVACFKGSFVCICGKEHDVVYANATECPKCLTLWHAAPGNIPVMSPEEHHFARLQSERSSLKAKCTALQEENAALRLEVQRLTEDYRLADQSAHQHAKEIDSLRKLLSESEAALVRVRADAKNYSDGAGKWRDEHHSLEERFTKLAVAFSDLAVSRGEKL